ncbi:phosphotransferase, partial [Enterobacter chuandaensis]
LRKTGEPQPIRLSPLHMDVHAGNIVHTPEGGRLIDWEYAGDGDVALELAAVWTESEAARQKLI